LPPLDLNHDLADAVGAAEQQRASVQNAGYGPVRTGGDASLPSSSATAAVERGRMARSAPENTPQQIAALTTKPLAPTSYVPPVGLESEEDAHAQRAAAAGQQRSFATGRVATGQAPMQGPAETPGTVGSETIGAAVQGVTYEADAEHPTGQPFHAAGAADEHVPE